MKISNKIKKLISEWLCRHCQVSFFYNEKDKFVEALIYIYGIKVAVFVISGSKNNRKIEKFFPLLD